MYRNMAPIIVIALCVFEGTALSADWKFYGESTTVRGVDECMFYDSSSIINTNNSIKLLVKEVLSSDIEKLLENQSVIEKATAKTANGYVAPITKIYPNVTNAVLLEEAVNETKIKTKAELSYQIVCAENKYRRITGTTYHKDGSPEMLLGITKWEHIAPESNAENLVKILCGTSK